MKFLVTLLVVVQLSSQVRSGVITVGDEDSGIYTKLYRAPPTQVAEQVVIDVPTFNVAEVEVVPEDVAIEHDDSDAVLFTPTDGDVEKDVTPTFYHVSTTRNRNKIINQGSYHNSIGHNHGGKRRPGPIREIIKGIAAGIASANRPHNHGHSHHGGQYPNQGGYYPNQGGYHPNQGGYYPNQGGYYPNQGGYHPNQGGYYPGQGGHYPNQGGHHNHGHGGHNPHGNYIPHGRPHGHNHGRPHGHNHGRPHGHNHGRPHGGNYG